MRPAAGTSTPSAQLLFAIVQAASNRWPATTVDVCLRVSAWAPGRDPFVEFPYVADCDRAATIALVLSVIARAAIDGCVPMYAAQAPTPGTGKGLLVHVAAMIATGRKAPLMAPDDNDDEARKRLLAIAMESPSSGRGGGVPSSRWWRCWSPMAAAAVVVVVAELVVLAGGRGGRRAQSMPRRTR